MVSIWFLFILRPFISLLSSSCTSQTASFISFISSFF
jgi:hypothetical protein